jgi:hypothetical protein
MESMFHILRRRYKEQIKLLINSRQDLPGHVEQCEQINLTPLPEADGLELLGRAAGRDVEWEGGIAEKLVEICKGNALTLTLLASILNKKRCTPKVRPIHDIVDGDGI